jgi:aryl-alcohol dehydrogenase-like predicted oxidoreductase
LKTAFDVGINLIDTADVYSSGKSEETLGKLLADYKRSDYVLATKCFGKTGNAPNDKGLSRKHIFEACEASLKRLKVDYLDIFQTHRFDYSTPLEETLQAMNDLVKTGKILYFGVSQWSAVEITNSVRIAERSNLAKPVSNQPIYNLLNRSLEVDVLEVCEKEGLGILCYSPLAQGVLTGKYTKTDEVPKNSRADNQMTKSFIQKRLTQENIAKVEKLTEIAEESGISMSQLALSWILRRKAISSVITGATKPEQILQNAKASGVNLSSEVLVKIEEILQNSPFDQYTGIAVGYDAPKPKGF